MTTPSRVEEILAEMAANPELEAALRDRILGDMPSVIRQNQELMLKVMEQQLELSQAFRQFGETSTQAIQHLIEMVARLSETVERHEQRLDQHEAAITALQAGQDTLAREVASLRTAVERIETQVQQMNVRLERLEALYEQMNTRIGRMEERQERLEARQGRLEARQERMEERQARTEERQERMEERQARTEERQERTEERQDRMENDIVDLKSVQRTILGRLSNLQGKEYERKAASRSPHLAVARLGADRPRIAFTQQNGESPDFARTTQQAIRAGQVSHEDLEDILNSDIILMENGPAYIVIEASITAEDSDVTRAAQRAVALSRATGLPARAAVIADTTPEHIAALAGSRDVAIIHLRE